MVRSKPMAPSPIRVLIVHHCRCVQINADCALSYPGPHHQCVQINSDGALSYPSPHCAPLPICSDQCRWRPLISESSSPMCSDQCRWRPIGDLSLHGAAIHYGANCLELPSSCVTLCGFNKLPTLVGTASHDATFSSSDFPTVRHPSPPPLPVSVTSARSHRRRVPTPALCQQVIFNFPHFLPAHLHNPHNQTGFNCPAPRRKIMWLSGKS